MNKATYMRCLLDFHIYCYHIPGGPMNSIKQMDLLRKIKAVIIASFEHHHFCVQRCLVRSNGLFYGLYHSWLSVIFFEQCQFGPQCHILPSPKCLS